MAFSQSRRRSAWLLMGVAALLFGGCATQPQTGSPSKADTPLLRLKPSTLGHTLMLQQQLTVTAREQVHKFDVLLEVDADEVRLAILNLGQTGARLEWNGRTLTETRATWWPLLVRSERILSDLQFVLWPADVVRAALPIDWSLDTDPGGRVLRHEGQAVIIIRYPSPTHAEVVHVRDRYRLEIDSHALGAKW